MRQSSFGSGPFHLGHWGPKQRENDWLDDELFRGGGLRNEPARLGRVGERARERTGMGERESPLSLYRFLHVEDGNPSKKLAPNCTNTCHRKFAEMKYWCGCTEPSADRRGEVFAEGSIRCLNLHVGLHQEQRRGSFSAPAICPFSVCMSTALHRRHVCPQSSRLIRRSFPKCDMNATPFLKVWPAELWVRCPVRPQGALMWYVRKERMTPERAREGGRRMSGGRETEGG